MQNRSADELYFLVQSMTKAEKRQFTIRHRTKTARLFDSLNCNTPFRDAQLHNLRAVLYKQLLSTMRNIPAAKSIEQQLHEGIEDARILFEKRLYMQCYRLLQKVKKLAIAYHQVSFRFQAISMEKKMAALQLIYIDISVLQKETDAIAAELASISHWSKVFLLIYAWHARNGHVLNEREKKEAHSLLNDSVIPVGFYAGLYAWQAKTFHAFILNDDCYKCFAKKWLDHFEKEPQMKSIEHLQYVKAKKFLVADADKPLEQYRDTAESTSRYYLYAKKLFEEELYNEALDYLNPIINERDFYRTDLQIGARKMQVTCHEKLGNNEIIDSLERSMKRFAKERE